MLCIHWLVNDVDAEDIAPVLYVRMRDLLREGERIGGVNDENIGRVWVGVHNRHIVLVAVGSWLTKPRRNGGDDALLALENQAITTCPVSTVDARCPNTQQALHERLLLLVIGLDTGYGGEGCGRPRQDRHCDDDQYGSIYPRQQSGARR